MGLTKPMPSNKGSHQNNKPTDAANLWGSQPIPYSQEDEEAVIGSVLVSESVFDLLTILEPEDFFILRNKYIWQAFHRLKGQGQSIDYLTVQTVLKEMNVIGEIGGPAYLTQLINNTPSHTHARTYAGAVKAASIRRKGMTFAHDFFKTMIDLDMPLHQSMLDLSRSFDEWRAAMPNITTVSATAAADELAAYMDQPELSRPGIMSGLRDYDELVGGFIPKRVYLFAGDTGMGKSALLQNIVLNNPDLRIAYFSTEMPAQDVMARFLKIKTGIDQRMIRDRILNDQQKQLVRSTLQELAQRKFFIDYDLNQALTPERIRARAIQLKGQYGLDLLIVDHASDMGAGPGFEKATTEAKQEYIAQGLKLLASGLDVPVLVALQINREAISQKDKRPNKSHLRGSGRWEQLANVITFIYREVVYKPDTTEPSMGELIVAKARDDGRTGTAKVYCDSARDAFLNAVIRNADFTNYNEYMEEPPERDLSDFDAAFGNPE